MGCGFANAQTITLMSSRSATVVNIVVRSEGIPIVTMPMHETDFLTDDCLEEKLRRLSEFDED